MINHSFSDLSGLNTHLPIFHSFIIVEGAGNQYFLNFKETENRKFIVSESLQNYLLDTL